MDDIDISYSLDPQGYLVGVNAIDQANSRLQTSTAGVTTQATLLGRVWDLVTPKRAAIAGLLGLAQQAAGAQQSLSSLSAISTTTGTNVNVLAGGINRLSREFPVSQGGAQALVEQLTRVGAGADGSGRRVLALAEATTKLAGATGDNVSGLAQGMTELSRATGNTNLDPKRYAALGDALTTVSAQSGAGATNVLSFSKSIAPMAQSAGIGATGVLGIATAFSKMGEDGLGASTAVNKMLTDLNKSVRDGGPELKTYASMVGQTTEQFTALFKQNPAQALTQITQAIASAGPSEAPRMLERIGIEGVRGTRAIQALVSGGGLAPAIQQATAAYGSGSTEKASAAAYGGLNDSLTELRNTSQQTAQALGAPLLAPLTAFTDALKIPIKGLNALASSGVGQAALTGGGILAGGALLAKGAVGPIGTLALGRQALTSGPLVSMMAGIADAQGMGDDSRLGRYSKVGRDRAKEGTLNRGMLGGVNEFLYGLANPSGERQPDRAGKSGPSSGGVAARLKAYGFGGVETFLGATATQLNNAAEKDFGKRTDSLGASQNFKDGGEQAKKAYREAREGGSGVFDSMKAGLGGLDSGVLGDKAGEAFEARFVAGKGGIEDLDKASRGAAKGLEETRKSSASFGSTLRAFGGVAAANGRAAGALGGDVLRGVGKGVGAVAGFLGPGMLVGMGVSAGIAGISALNDRKNQRQQDNRDWNDQDISGTINAYRESIGKSTDSTKTYTSQSDNMRAQLVQSSKAATFGTVRKITDNDAEAATQSGDKITRKYAGGAEQIAAQIALASPGGIAPEELQAVKVDLLRQMPRDQAAKVLGLIPDSLSTTNPGGVVAANVDDSVRTALGDTSLETRTMMAPGNERTGVTMKDDLSDEQKKSLDVVFEGLAQRREKEGTTYEGGYADERQRTTFASMLQQASKADNQPLMQELARRQASTIGGDDYANRQFSDGELKAYNYDISRLIGDETKGARGSVSALTGAKPVVRQDIAFSQIQPESAFLASGYDATKPSSMRDSVMKALGSPDNTKIGVEANTAVIRASQDAGMSLADLAKQIRAAASAAGQGSAAWQQLQSVLRQVATLQSLQDASGTGMSMDQIQMGQTQRAMDQANGPTSTPEELATQQQGAQDVAAAANATRSRMQARLQVQFDYNKQVTRTNEAFGVSQARQEEQTGIARDRAIRNTNIGISRQTVQFNLSRTRAEADFGKQRDRAAYDANLGLSRQATAFNRDIMRQTSDFGVQRARTVRDAGISEQRAQSDNAVQVSRQRRDFALSERRQAEDFGTTRARAARDFGIQALRVEEDYATQRSRSIRDFGIGARRAEQDYLTSRLRSIRDFNKQMARQVEDGTKSMMNPYERLKAQATWDVGNLMVNLAEQQRAMEAQKANLDKARKAGLSSQTIDQLGLGKTENSQQLQTIVADLNPETVAQLNKATAGRAAAAGSLYTDASNKELARSKEDFNQTLADSEADYQKSVERSRADFLKSQTDSAKDFAKSTSRTQQDFARSSADQMRDFAKSTSRARADFSRQLTDSGADFAKSIGRSRQDLVKSLADSNTDFVKSQARARTDFAVSVANTRTDIKTSITRSETDFKQSQGRSAADFRTTLSNTRKDLGTSLSDMAKDAKTARTNARADLKTQLKNMGTDLKDADKSMTGDLSLLTTQFGNAINGRFINWGSVFSSTSRTWLTDVTRNFIPQFNGLLDKLGINTPSTNAKTQAAARNAAANPYGKGLSGANKKILGLHTGGSVEGYSSHDREDNIPAMLTGGEFVHKVASVRHYGTDAMKAINEQRVPKELLQHFADGGYVRPVTQFPSWPVWGHYRSGRRHPGIDFPSAANTPIHSPWSGTVVVRGWDPMGFGNHVRMSSPNGIYSILGHMIRPAPVTPGQRVSQGQLMGNVGSTGHSTGNHVHLEMRRGGAYNSGGSFDFTKSWGLGRVWTGKGADTTGGGGWGISTALDGIFGTVAAAAKPGATEQQVKALMAPLRAKYKVFPGEDYTDLLENQVRKEYVYDRGGMLKPGQRGRNDGSTPEPVLTQEQWRNISALAKVAAIDLRGSDARGVRSSRGVSIVVNNSGATTYDQRNDFAGAVFHLEPTSLSDFTQQLKEKQKMDRLTATRR